MITITPAIRRMIGNHGEPLPRIRPTYSNVYAILQDWDDPNETTIEIFAIIDHSGWKRELAPMEVSGIALERFATLEFGRGELSFPAFGRDALTGGAMASVTFFQGPAHVPGLLVRIENEVVGTFYFTSKFEPWINVDTGERSPADRPAFVRQGQTLTAGYSLTSHGDGTGDPEPYLPCEDIHFAHGEAYFG